MEDQRGLDLSGGKTVSGDVDDIWVLFSLSSLKRENVETPTVYTTLDPDVSVFIAGSAITGVEESIEWLEGQGQKRHRPGRAEAQTLI